MNSEPPSDRRYLETHEWARREGDTVRVGITAFIRNELGEIVFVELPSVGETVEAGDPFGVIESVKSISDLYAPISGDVRAVNGELTDTPALLNDDPFGDGWMLEIEPAAESGFDELLPPEAYGSRIT
ncbi:glycine cleavage system protein GcvH [Natronomonas sp. LN261]|jgi:glycine cleavage system H protein|uniref:glycine cleavage system protein GcvH n=1 Tax=Natronomonas sp. LN261 TaxID=2750669 RepID=UPI0015EEC96A|nr:glycine cleavage system protein GcvH [Natronomonas sp. LN261]